MKPALLYYIKLGLVLGMLSSLSACGQKKGSPAANTPAADASAADKTAADKSAADTSTNKTTPAAGATTADPNKTTQTPTGATGTPSSTAPAGTANTAVDTAAAPPAVTPPAKTTPAQIPAPVQANPAQQQVDKLDQDVKTKVAENPELKKKIASTQAFADYLQLAKDLNDETWRNYEGADSDSRLTFLPDKMYAHLACSSLHLATELTVARLAWVGLGEASVRLMLRSRSRLGQSITNRIIQPNLLSVNRGIVKVQLTRLASIARFIGKWTLVTEIIRDPANKEIIKSFFPEWRQESSNPIDQAAHDAADYEELGLSADDARSMSQLFKVEDKDHPEIGEQDFKKLQEIIKRNSEALSEPTPLLENMISDCTKETERLHRRHSIYEAGQIKLEEYRELLVQP